MNQQVSVSVPGKHMLCGEYAVLKGGPSLALTLGSKLEVELRRKSAGELSTLNSDLWADTIYFGPLDSERYSPLDRKASPLLDSTLSAAAIFKVEPFDLKVHSQLKVEHGVGSSGALRLAVNAAFQLLAEGPQANLMQSARYAFEQQKAQQVIASGYDILCQYLGGMVRFESDSHFWPGPHTRLKPKEERLRNLHLWVGGGGCPTGPMVRSTMHWIEAGKLWQDLLKLNQKIVKETEEYLAGSQDSFHHLAELWGQWRLLFSSSPCEVQSWTSALDLPGLDQKWSFKLTGAGGQDALLILAEPSFFALEIEPTLLRLGLSAYPEIFSQDGLHFKFGS